MLGLLPFAVPVPSLGGLLVMLASTSHRLQGSLDSMGVLYVAWGVASRLLVLGFGQGSGRHLGVGRKSSLGR